MNSKPQIWFLPSNLRNFFFRKSNIWVEYSHDISLLPFWYFLCKDFQSKFALSQLTLKQYIFKSDCLSTKKNSSKIKMGLKLCHLFTVIVHFLIRSRARMLPLKIIYFFKRIYSIPYTCTVILVYEYTKHTIYDMYLTHFYIFIYIFITSIF